jgi:hypothetical protein
MTDDRKPWERQSDEPILWYDRFLVYLQLPNPRTISAAIRKWSQDNPNARRTKERDDRGQPPYLLTSWSRAAKKYKWEERAIAYDTWRFDQLEMIRRNALIGISGLVDDALRTLRQLLNSLDDNVRFEAVKFIFDKIGLYDIAHVKIQADNPIVSDKQLVQIIMQDESILQAIREYLADTDLLVQFKHGLLEDGDSKK